VSYLSRKRISATGSVFCATANAETGYYQHSYWSDIVRKIWAVTLYHTRLSFDRLPHIINGWIRRKILI